MSFLRDLIVFCWWWWGFFWELCLCFKLKSFSLHWSLNFILHCISSTLTFIIIHSLFTRFVRNLGTNGIIISSLVHHLTLFFMVGSAALEKEQAEEGAGLLVSPRMSNVDWLSSPFTGFIFHLYALANQSKRWYLFSCLSQVS